MPRRRHKPEEIVAKLRQVEVLAAQGTLVAEVIRSIGVTEITYYRWRSEYGGLKSNQVKRLKELEVENSPLQRAVSDLTLEKADSEGGGIGRLLSPTRCRACVEHAIAERGISARPAPLATG